MSTGRDGAPVLEGEPGVQMLEVPELSETVHGRWRLVHIAKDATFPSSRTALSSDRGLSWSLESDSPFDDLETIDEDRRAECRPCAVQARGRYPCRGHAAGGSPVLLEKLRWPQLLGEGGERADRPRLRGGRAEREGLFDPAIAQLDDGTIRLFVTVGTEAEDFAVTATMTIIDP